jgi:hypothetical protein
VWKGNVVDAANLTALLPLLVIAATALAVLLVVAFWRHHLMVMVVTLGGLVAALARPCR